MHVLVTGGGGYIGSVLVRRLLEAGHTARVLDRLYWGLDPLQDVIDRVELVQADIREVNDSWFSGVDAVIHLAGLSNDPTANFDPAANWEINARATDELGQAARRNGVQRFVFASSCSLYDGLPDGSVYDEEAPIEPRGPYAESKRFGEEALLRLAGPDFSPVILRCGTVFGLSPRMRFDLVVNTFVKDALTQGRLVLHGGGVMHRPLVEVQDTADAMVACLTPSDALVGGQVFNVVQANYTVRELAEHVAAALQRSGRDVDLVDAPAPALVRNYSCSGQKLADVVGLTLHRDVAASVDAMTTAFAAMSTTRFGHPSFYNLEWMVLLKEVHSSLRPFDYVLRRGEIALSE